MKIQKLALGHLKNKKFFNIILAYYRVNGTENTEVYTCINTYFTLTYFTVTFVLFRIFTHSYCKIMDWWWLDSDCFRAVWQVSWLSACHHSVSDRDLWPQIRGRKPKRDFSHQYTFTLLFHHLWTFTPKRLAHWPWPQWKGVSVCVCKLKLSLNIWQHLEMRIYGIAISRAIFF